MALLGGPVGAVRARFDLVVANILADTLVEEATALAAAVAPGGRLVLSGLLAEQVTRVLAAFPGWRVTGQRACVTTATTVISAATSTKRYRRNVRGPAYASPYLAAVKPVLHSRTNSRGNAS